MSKKRSIAKSFGYAFEGFREAFQKEPNFRIHISVALLAIVLGAYFRIDRLEWMVLFLSIFLVIILELINTTLEALVDIVQPTFHKSAKIAKDVSAAVVLLGAISAIVAGAIIFIPRILAFF